MAGLTPEEAIRGLRRDPANFHDLPYEDQVATAQAQGYPNFSRDYKFNPEAFQSWLQTGPFSTNIDDRRPVPATDRDFYHLMRLMGAPDEVLNRYLPKEKNPRGPR